MYRFMQTFLYALLALCLSIASWMMGSGWHYLAWLFGLLASFIIVKSLHCDRRLKRFLAEANVLHGTQFGLKNGFGTQDCIIFDPNARKVFMALGKNYRVEDFSFIRRYQLHWTALQNLKAGTLRYKNVYIEFETIDYNQPLLRFGCLTKRQGEIWIARLNTLFQ